MAAALKHTDGEITFFLSCITDDEHKNVEILLEIVHEVQCAGRLVACFQIDKKDFYHDGDLSCGAR